MSSPNGRALRRLVALAMLSGVVLIALFCVVEQAQIRHRAVETLTAFKTDPHTEPDGAGQRAGAPDYRGAGAG